jgi:integrase
VSHGFKYVRLVKGKYPRFRTRATGDIALPGPIGSPAFLRGYAGALDRLEAARANPLPDAPHPSSWRFLVARFLASPDFAALAEPTRLDYSRTAGLLLAELGDQPFRLTTRGMLKAVRDDLAATPRKAHKVKQLTSRIYGWAAENDLVPDGFNPAAGLKRLKTKGGVREIAVWSEAEIGWILAAADGAVKAPLMLFLFTGQRERDVPAMRWNQFQGDVIRVRTSKTGALLDLPCHPELRRFLEQLRRERKVIDLAGHICLDEKGRPWTIGQLNGRIRRLVEKVAKTRPIPGARSPHGLRYAAASRMEEGGATHAEIAEVLGHRTFRMALKYAGQRVRARSAVAAMPGGTNREGGN